MYQVISIRLPVMAACLLSGLFIAASNAAEKVLFVNKTSDTVHLAVGTSGPIFQDPVFGSGSGDAWVEGWADIAPGGSTTYVAPKGGSVVSYYASSNKGKWTGTVKNLVLPFKKFKIKNPHQMDDDRREAGYEYRMFRVITPGQTTVNLTLGAAP